MPKPKMQGNNDYIPAALAILGGLGFAGLLSLAAIFIGPQRPNKAKGVSYEAGSDVIGSPRAPFSVKFYQVAILFLVFDIEAAFLYPWAVNFRELSCDGEFAAGVCSGSVSFFGIGSVMAFMAILVVALAYVWRKRAVGWES
ncbi:MAG: NADH-quinone oxidoreductase subunit A [Deltaproteobacteria bacterium]|nr:NADH-quinone oxidoreductase subunit A [Deltaproteobacteria bacterium]